MLGGGSLRSNTAVPLVQMWTIGELAVHDSVRIGFVYYYCPCEEIPKQHVPVLKMWHLSRSFCDSSKHDDGFGGRGGMP